MDETRRKLMDVAGEIFAEKGFQAATIRRICGQAGVNLAAINYHFGDKERLYAEVVKYAHCMAEENGPPPVNAGAPPEEKLRQFIGVMMHSMWDHQQPSWQSELVMREMARPTNASVELVRGFIGPKFDRLLSIIAELTPPTLPMRDRHLLAFSVVAQCLLYRFHRPVGKLLVGEEEFAGYQVDQLADHITTFSLGGVRAVVDAKQKGSP